MAFLKKVAFRGGRVLFVSTDPTLARLTRVVGEQTGQLHLSLTCTLALNLALTLALTLTLKPHPHPHPPRPVLPPPPPPTFLSLPPPL